MRGQLTAMTARGPEFDLFIVVARGDDGEQPPRRNGGTLAAHPSASTLAANEEALASPIVRVSTAIDPARPDVSIEAWGQ